MKPTKARRPSNPQPSASSSSSSSSSSAADSIYRPLLSCKPCDLSVHLSKQNCKSNPSCVYGLGGPHCGARIHKSAAATRKEFDIWNKAFNFTALLGPHPQLNYRPASIPVGGLYNTGATCYFNVVLQALAAWAPARLAVYYLSLSTTNNNNNNNNSSSSNGNSKSSSSGSGSCSSNDMACESKASESARADPEAVPLRALQLLFYLLEKGQASALRPHRLTSLLGLDPLSQQDPMEFLKLFLTRFEKHWGRLRPISGGNSNLNNGKNSDNSNGSTSAATTTTSTSAALNSSSSNKSSSPVLPLDALFQGVETTEITCQTCLVKSVRATALSDLKLYLGDVSKGGEKEGEGDRGVIDIDSTSSNNGSSKSKVCPKAAKPSKKDTDAVTLDSCLRSYFAEEHLTGDNQYMCSNCHALRDALKTVRMGGPLSSDKASDASVGKSWPIALPIHLLRYKFDKETGSRVKLRTRVEFPAEASFGGDQFLLTSAVYHLGDSAYGGHYVCDVFYPASGSSAAGAGAGPGAGGAPIVNGEIVGHWYHCDDNNVRPTTCPGSVSPGSHATASSSTSKH